MKIWFLPTIGLSLAGLALAADPPKKLEVIPEAERGEGVSLTVYNQNFAVVKERRKMSLKEGRAEVRFKDVAATIVPESVQFSVLRQADLARVAEQNYEFDLVSADKLLDKYIDREIAVVTQDGETIRGKLLSFDPGQIVLRTDKGVDLVPRDRNVKDIQFSSLPGGLLTRPTLVWKLDAKTTADELIKVAYRANGMTWRVDYRARVNQAGDKLNLSGWITVTNNTSNTFKDAQVKLMAGDVRVLTPMRGPEKTPTSATGATYTLTKQLVTEKAFADYHLYELGRKATLKDRETKQIELLDVEDIPVTRKYAYRGEANNVAVMLEFKNSKKTAPGLGIPLPKGPIRVFQRDADNELEFAGSDAIDHTPKDELVKVRLGYAFDLKAEQRQLNVRHGPNWTEQDWEVRVRNHKTEAVSVDVYAAIQGYSNWVMVKNSHPFRQQDVSTLIFPIEVKANAEVVLTYTIKYFW